MRLLIQKVPSELFGKYFSFTAAVALRLSGKGDGAARNEGGGSTNGNPRDFSKLK